MTPPDTSRHVTDFRGQDLNLRPPGYEPGELPLLHPGIYFAGGVDAAAAAAATFALTPLCPRKIRVGANSPSLCPTMSSVTNSLMNCRPLWTRKLWPMKSGTIVQSRDH